MSLVTGQESLRRIHSDDERQAPISILEAEPSHLARYQFAQRYVKNQDRVLDMPCGSGYGTAVLAQKAREVFGVDISSRAIGHAQDFFGPEGGRFGVENAEDVSEALELTGPFDVVVSFEGIEHVPNPDRFLQNAKKLLASDGVLIISTPRKPHGSPHHIIEFSREEFQGILTKNGFSISEVYGQIYTDIFELSSRPHIDPHLFNRFNYIVVCTKKITHPFERGV